MSYLGKYRGEVLDVKDPEGRGRIRVKCPAVTGEQMTRWALPCFPPNTFTVPQIGELVWVEFEGGNMDSPIWTGVFYTKQQFDSKFNYPEYEPKDIIETSTRDKKEIIKRDRGIFITRNNYEEAKDFTRTII